MRLLAQRVPLTLLLDLLAPPDAQEIYRRELRPQGPGHATVDLDG